MKDVKAAVAFINLVLLTKVVNDYIEIWTPIHGHVNTPRDTVFFGIWCSWSRNFPLFWKSQLLHQQPVQSSSRVCAHFSEVCHNVFRQFSKSSPTWALPLVFSSEYLLCSSTVVLHDGCHSSLKPTWCLSSEPVMFLSTECPRTYCLASAITQLMAASNVYHQ